MPGLQFGREGKIVFPTKYHGAVSLSQVKWNTICSQPERRYYGFNGEKIATTLINPDLVRHHQKEKNQFFYYKKFSTIKLDDSIEVSPVGGVYFAVIIDDSTRRVCTVYPVVKPKVGKQFKAL